MNQLQMEIALAEAARASLATERETGVPASLSLAQWAIESGWGVHTPGNNCFGIKASDPHSVGTQTQQTVEYIEGRPEPVLQEFAVYDSVLDCFRAHAALIVHGRAFRFVWAEYLSHRDVDALARALAPLYATDPKYADVLRIVMHGQRVQRALQAARVSVAGSEV